MGRASSRADRSTRAMTKANWYGQGEWNGETLPLLPFESPESVVMKFGWANEITLHQAADVIRAAVSDMDALEQLRLPRNWKVWLNAYSNNEQLARATICDALREDDWLIFVMDRLRFCPICLSAGFHTWWHQCRLHTTCLLHGCLLVSGCACCDTPIQIEVGTRLSLRRSYLCSRCAQPVSGVEPTWDAIMDIASLRPLLISRYTPWAYWLNRLGEFRMGWHRIHQSWYSECDNGRLKNQRAARESALVLLTCPPPADLGKTSSPDVSITEINVCAAIDYDPGGVVAQFVSIIEDMFDRSEHEQYRYCQCNFCNGLRIHAGHISPAPLALWILTSYSEWCRRHSDPDRIWRVECASSEEAWVWRLSSLIGGVRPDAGGLHVLLLTIYSELLAWLSPCATRECFDLDFERMSLFPGISAYEIADDDGYVRSVVLIRPADGKSAGQGFSLVSGSARIWRPRVAVKHWQCGQYPDACLKAPSECHRRRFANSLSSSRYTSKWDFVTYSTSGD